jgi:hypothetical protein
MDVSAIINQLDSGAGLPRAALLAAGRQQQEMAPVFAGEIEKYLSSASGESSSSDALFFMVHLLGSWRETKAYRPLARLLRRPEEELDAIFGDGLTETCHRVMAAVFDGDPQPIYDIILDPTAFEFIRSSMCETLAMLVWQGQLDRAQVARFLRDCFMHLLPQANSVVWDGWQQTIAILGLKELSPLVEKAFERGYVASWILSFENFQERLHDALESPGHALHTEGRYYTPFGDTIEELSRWHAFSAEAERQRRLEQALNRPKDVGRNDPCPCGSGKKYKKCCLN